MVILYYKLGKVEVQNEKRVSESFLVIGMGISITTTDVYATLVVNEGNSSYSYDGELVGISGSGSSSDSSSAGKWYYNTGTSLPKDPDYSKHNLSSVLAKGDIIYEKNGGGGLTGHIAIVEGRFYDSVRKKYYFRIIEAILPGGVVRSVLDDERVADKDVRIYRVKGATAEQKRNAIDFCISQLGKGYDLDFRKDTSAKQKNWYCSELVWAAYKNQGINIDTDDFFTIPGVTPKDIISSPNTYKISFK